MVLVIVVTHMQDVLLPVLSEKIVRRSPCIRHGFKSLKWFAKYGGAKHPSILLKNLFGEESISNL